MRIWSRLVCLSIVLIGMGALFNRAEDSPPSAPAALVATPVQIPGLQNTFRVTDQIYSGSQPDSDAAFAGLAKLGVKTIVSVDGSKPDIAKARQYGLQYVHLPFGYAGVPTNRVADLAKVTTLKPGPFYVHCHHGQHRGPAAVAVMCESVAGWSPTQAIAWLRQAGTSDDYPGLYRAAREFKTPTSAELAAVKSLPELAASTSWVDAMVAIDEHFSWLNLCQKAGWAPPPRHPDISPKHEATILWEQFRELPRVSDLAARPADFRKKLADAEMAADHLRTLLNTPADAGGLDAALKQSAETCAACHKSYRN